MTMKKSIDVCFLISCHGTCDIIVLEADAQEPVEHTFQDERDPPVFCHSSQKRILQVGSVRANSRIVNVEQNNESTDCVWAIRVDALVLGNNGHGVELTILEDGIVVDRPLFSLHIPFVTHEDTWVGVQLT